MVHKINLLDLKVADQVKANRALLIAKKEHFVKLKNPNSQASGADREALREAIKELGGSITSL